MTDSQDEVSEDRDPPTLPLSTISSTEPSLSDTELRWAQVIEKGISAALDKREPEPVEFVVPPEPVFEGTYNRRPHLMMILMEIVLLPLTILIGGYLFFTAGYWIYKGLIFVVNLESGHTEKVQSLEPWLTYWVPLILIVVLSGWLIWASIPQIAERTFTHRIITLTHVLIRCKAPGAFWNFFLRISDVDEAIWRKDVKDVRISQTWFEKLFGFATVKFETEVQTDIAFQTIPYWSRPKEVRRLFPIDDIV